MAGWLDTYRGVVFPWHCDQFGHMNVRWYGHHFDDAAFHIWPMVGIGWQRMEAMGVHTVVARTSTEYRKELTAGTLIRIQSGFTRVGGKSVTYLQRMFDAETGTLHAEYEGVEVFFDPETRKAVEMPAELRRELDAALVDPDAG